MAEDQPKYNEYGYKILNFDAPNDEQIWGTLNRQWLLAKEMRKLLAKEPFHYFVTAAFNGEHTVEYAKAQLGKWHKFIDRKVAGPNHTKKPKEQRIFFVAGFEHLKTNIHAHLLLRLPDKEKANIFEEHADLLWQKLVPAGDMDIRSFTHERGNIGATFYSGKDLHKPENYDAFTISTEFSSRYSCGQS